MNGIFIVELKIFNDNRGTFLKAFNYDTFKELGFSTDFKENYFPISNKNVIRGMHFQVPPQDHDKLVYVSKGRIIDCVLDIRKNSETYGKHFFIEMSDKNGYLTYISKGFAHGFLSLEDNTIVNYMQTTTHSVECDSGIKYDSFGMNWNIENPIISTRDLSFETFSNFVSPF